MYEFRVTSLQALECVSSNLTVNFKLTTEMYNEIYDDD